MNNNNLPVNKLYSVYNWRVVLQAKATPNIYPYQRHCYFMRFLIIPVGIRVHFKLTINCITISK